MRKKQTEKKVFREGQSVVEYLVLVGAIIGVLVVFLGPGGYFSKSYNAVIERQGDDALNVAKILFF